jgi:hypothetical protein
MNTPFRHEEQNDYAKGCRIYTRENTLLQHDKHEVGIQIG